MSSFGLPYKFFLTSLTGAACIVYMQGFSNIKVFMYSFVTELS